MDESGRGGREAENWCERNGWEAWADGGLKSWVSSFGDEANFWREELENARLGSWADGAGLRPLLPIQRLLALKNAKE